MTESAAQMYEEHQYRCWLNDPVDLGKRMRDALVPARQEPALTYNTDLVPSFPHPQQSSITPEITARQRDYATLRSEYNDARIMMQWSLAGGYRAPEYLETVAKYEAARMAMRKHLDEGIALHENPNYTQSVRARWDEAFAANKANGGMRGKVEVIRDADLFDHTYNPPSVLAVAPEKSADPNDGWPSDMAHQHARGLMREGVKNLSSSARKVLRAELDKADAPLTGRSAQDAAIGGIGRALTGGMTRYGLRTGA